MRSLNRLLRITMPHGGQNIAKFGSGELPDIEDCILVTEADYSTASDLFEKGQIEEIRTKLLAWYDKNRRKLPWRGDKPPYGKKVAKKEVAFFSSPECTGIDTSAATDPSKFKAVQTQRVPPYYTWVSEIMCQQTRVETVIEYFSRWISKFPTIDCSTVSSLSPNI